MLEKARQFAASEWIFEDPDGVNGRRIPPSVLAQLRRYQASARSARSKHAIVEISGLAVSAAIPALAAFGADARVIAVFGSLAVLIGGIRALAGYKESWTSRTRARYEIQREIALFAVQHGRYAGDDAARNLVEAVEEITARERDGWVALRLSYDPVGSTLTGREHKP